MLRIMDRIQDQYKLKYKNLISSSVSYRFWLGGGINVVVLILNGNEHWFKNQVGQEVPSTDPPLHQISLGQFWIELKRGQFEVWGVFSLSPFKVELLLPLILWFSQRWRARHCKESLACGCQQSMMSPDLTVAGCDLSWWSVLSFMGCLACRLSAASAMT